MQHKQTISMKQTKRIIKTITADAICIRKNWWKIALTPICILALLTAQPTSVFAQAAGSCYNTQNGQPPSLPAGCDCNAGVFVGHLPSCETTTGGYCITTAYTQCNGGTDQSGSASCKDSSQPVGYYYHCDRSVNWGIVLGYAGVAAGVCGVVCVITPPACGWCILSFIEGGGIVGIDTCAFVTCTVKQDGPYKDSANPDLKGKCPQQG
jgi:hypothetical protein